MSKKAMTATEIEAFCEKHSRKHPNGLIAQSWRATQEMKAILAEMKTKSEARQKR